MRCVQLKTFAKMDKQFAFQYYERQTKRRKFKFQMKKRYFGTFFSITFTNSKFPNRCISTVVKL